MLFDRKLVRSPLSGLSGPGDTEVVVPGLTLVIGNNA